MKRVDLDEPKELYDGQLRVWWNTAHTNRHYYVPGVTVAIIVLETLAKREADDDSIAFNASGLEQWDETDREWTEWYNEDGLDIKELMDAEQ